MGFVSYLSVPAEDKDSNSGSSEVFKSGNSAPINLTTAFLVIFVSVLIYKTNILPAKANYATTRAIVRGWASDF